MEIGKRINLRRKELGLSLRELGDLAGVTASFLSQIENDQVSPIFKFIAKHFHSSKSTDLLFVK